MEIIAERALTFRPSEYDSVILNQISERNPQLTSPSDLLRIAIRTYDLESNDQNSKSKRLDRIEEQLGEIKERLLLLVDKFNSILEELAALRNDFVTLSDRVSSLESKLS